MRPHAIVPTLLLILFALPAFAGPLDQALDLDIRAGAIDADHGQPDEDMCCRQLIPPSSRPSCCQQSDGTSAQQCGDWH